MTPPAGELAPPWSVLKTSGLPLPSVSCKASTQKSWPRVLHEVQGTTYREHRFIMAARRVSPIECSGHGVRRVHRVQRCPAIVGVGLFGAGRRQPLRPIRCPTQGVAARMLSCQQFPVHLPSVSTYRTTGGCTQSSGETTRTGRFSQSSTWRLRPACGTASRIPVLYYETNVLGTLNLLELCREFSVSRVHPRVNVQRVRLPDDRPGRRGCTMRPSAVSLRRLQERCRDPAAFVPPHSWPRCRRSPVFYRIRACLAAPT